MITLILSRLFCIIFGHSWINKTTGDSYHGYKEYRQCLNCGKLTDLDKNTTKHKK